MSALKSTSSKSPKSTSTTHAKSSSHSTDSNTPAQLHAALDPAAAVAAQLPAASDPAATTQLPAATSPLPSAATPTDPFKAALALIAQAQRLLPLESGQTAKARHNALKLQIVPTEAIAEAASILGSEGHRFPTFDAQMARDAVQYEQSMAEVISGASALIGKAQASILQRRTPAAEQTLALYACLKGQSRTDGSLRDSVQRLSPLVNSRKHPHTTKAQREKAAAKKAPPTSAPPAPVAHAAETAAPSPAAAPPAASAPVATH